VNKETSRLSDGYVVGVRVQKKGVKADCKVFGMRNEKQHYPLRRKIVVGKLGRSGVQLGSILNIQG
jgi:hypothetical protein